MEALCQKISIYRVLLLVLYFFQIKLSFFPLHLYRCVYLVLLLIEITKHKYLLLNKLDYFFLCFTMFLIFFSCIRSCVSFDLTIVFYMIESVINLFSAVILFNLFYRRLSINILIQEIVFAILFQSIFMIVMLLSPPIKVFFNELFPSPVPREKWAWRHVGLTGFAAYNMGVFLSFGILLSLYLFMTNKLKTIQVLLYCMFFLVTALLSARSSFIVIFFCFLFFMQTFKKKKSINFALIIISVIICVFILLYRYSLENEKFKFIFDWMFSIVLTLFENEGLGDVQGIKVIGENYYWIPSFSTFLLGDGRYAGMNGEGYYMATDAGYMRRLLFFGFPMSILYYLSFIGYFLLNIIRISNKYFKQILLIILIVLMILQYKGDIFIDGGETLRLSFLLIYAFRNEEKKNENYVCSSIE